MIKGLAKETPLTAEQAVLTKEFFQSEFDHLIARMKEGDDTVVVKGNFVFITEDLNRGWLFDIEQKFSVCFYESGEFFDPIKVETDNQIGIQFSFKTVSVKLGVHEYIKVDLADSEGQAYTIGFPHDLGRYLFKQ